jgi:hypothetical protein
MRHPRPVRPLWLAARRVLLLGAVHRAAAEGGNQLVLSRRGHPRRGEISAQLRGHRVHGRRCLAVQEGDEQRPDHRKAGGGAVLAADVPAGMRYCISMPAS